MKLLTRFNLLFIGLFVLGLPITLWVANAYLQQQAESRVRAEAELIAEAATATRQYTEEQVKPLLARLQKHESSFLPQSVPTFSAIQVFDYLHRANPQYTYKDAMLNPTNPSDRAVGWEADLINAFRSNPNLKEVSRERQSSFGPSYFFAKPIIISDEQKACLDCHSAPSRAPATMLRQYGPDNGFGWTTNDIIGAQIISVPGSVPIEMARAGLRNWVVYLGLAALAMLMILDTMLIFTVIRPVARISHLADEVSQGRPVEDWPVKGNHEISVLAQSFNRMQRSLVRLMKMLEGEHTS